MAKRKKTIIAGSIVKTIIYTAPEPLDGKRARAEKSRMTTAAQKAMNDKAARGRLEMLMAANFTGRDLFITTTYRDDDLPPNRAEAVKRIRGFIKALREHRKARGQELKYIYTTEEKYSPSKLDDGKAFLGVCSGNAKCNKNFIKRDYFFHVFYDKMCTDELL